MEMTKDKTMDAFLETIADIVDAVSYTHLITHTIL